MPPKAPKNNNKSQSNKQELEAINKYLDQRPDFSKLLAEHSTAASSSPDLDVSEYDRQLQQATERFVAEMPVIPGENDKDMQAKLAEGKKEAEAKKDTVASIEHHKANPGPVIAENLGEPASKEELKKRSEELNK